jgi:hypothetical protein
MSSPAEKTGEAIGAAGVKLVCAGDAFAAGVSANALTTVSSRLSAIMPWPMEVLKVEIFMIVAFSVAGF